MKAIIAILDLIISIVLILGIIAIAMWITIIHYWKWILAIIISLILILNLS